MRARLLAADEASTPTTPKPMAAKQQSHAEVRALFAAMKRGDLDFVRAAATPALAKEKNAQGRTLMMEALFHQRMAFADLFKEHSDANKVDHQGCNALMITLLRVSSRRNEWVAHLAPKTNLSRPANDGQTALMMAAAAGDIASTRLLIELGASADAVDRQGCDALMLAIDAEQWGTAWLLIPLSNAMRADKGGSTALMRAAAAGHEKIVDLLLPLSDANAANDSGRNTLMLAIERRRWALVDKLAPKTNLRHTDANADTALHWFARASHRNTMKQDTAQSARFFPAELVEQKNQGGQTALQFSIAMKNWALMDVLTALLPLPRARELVASCPYAELPQTHARLEAVEIARAAGIKPPPDTDPQALSEPLSDGQAATPRAKPRSL